ncbi:hypothetical protein [Cupriavidus oxalaticus]
MRAIHYSNAGLRAPNDGRFQASAMCAGTARALPGCPRNTACDARQLR